MLSINKDPHAVPQAHDRKRNALLLKRNRRQRCPLSPPPFSTLAETAASTGRKENAAEGMQVIGVAQIAI